jgi:hypothetical protein
MSESTDQLAQGSTSICPPYEAFYIDSMHFSSSSAIESVSRVADTLEAVSNGTLERSDLDEDALLNQLHNIIVQGAALSRYFWPVRKGHELRGETSRRTIQAPSILRPLTDSLPRAGGVSTANRSVPANVRWNCRSDRHQVVRIATSVLSASRRPSPVARRPSRRCSTAQLDALGRGPALLHRNSECLRCPGSRGR